MSRTGRRIQAGPHSRSSSAYDALVAGGARFYVSGMSSKARGFDPGDVAEAAMPDRLVQLAFDADRVLSY